MSGREVQEEPWEVMRRDWSDARALGLSYPKDVHGGHCFQNEFVHSCKYGNEDCTARPTVFPYRTYDENGRVIDVDEDGIVREVPYLTRERAERLYAAFYRRLSPRKREDFDESSLTSDVQDLTDNQLTSALMHLDRLTTGGDHEHNFEIVKEKTDA